MLVVGSVAMLLLCLHTMYYISFNPLIDPSLDLISKLIYSTR